VTKAVNRDKEQIGSDITRYGWKEDKRSNFKNNISTEYVKEKLLSLEFDLENKYVNGAVQHMDTYEFYASDMKCAKKSYCIHCWKRE
jgi:hypothetical protein